jgi:hypothetical protein
VPRAPIEFGVLGGIGVHGAILGRNALTTSLTAFGAFGGRHAVYVQTTLQLGFGSGNGIISRDQINPFYQIYEDIAPERSGISTELGLLVGYRGYFSKGTTTWGVFAGVHPQYWILAKGKPDLKGLGLSFGPVVRSGNFYGQLAVNIQNLSINSATPSLNLISASLAAGAVL